MRPYLCIAAACVAFVAPGSIAQWRITSTELFGALAFDGVYDPIIQRMFEIFDLNENGVIDPAERPALKAALDPNGNGMTKEELQAWVSRELGLSPSYRRVAADLFNEVKRKHDSNGDGLIQTVPAAGSEMDGWLDELEWTGFAMTARQDAGCLAPLAETLVEFASTDTLPRTEVPSEVLGVLDDLLARGCDFKSHELDGMERYLAILSERELDVITQGPNRSGCVPPSGPLWEDILICRLPGYWEALAQPWEYEKEDQRF